MADNITVTPGTGATVATEDVAGVQHQKVKVEFGADGAATMVSASNPLPVVQTGTPALPTGAATAANQQNDALTNTQLRASAVPVSFTGSSDVATQTTLASINSKITAVNTGAVVISSALPAGTNAIGKLSANSGVDIGDVDVTSIVLPRNLIGPGQPGTAVDSYGHAVISTTANTADQSLIAAPGANKQIWVYGLHYVVGTAAGTVSFQDEDNTAISGVMSHALNSGGGFPPSGNFSMPMWKVATNKALEVDCVTCDIEGWINYAIVSV